jgi:chemotaxis protein histidine kinase CheA
VNEDEFDEVLARLTGEYKAGLPARLDEMVVLWGRLSTNRTDAEASKKLHFHFHYFSGSGGSFGLPELSDEATKAETALSAAVRANRTLTDEECLIITTQLGVVRRIVDGG